MAPRKNRASNPWPPPLALAGSLLAMTCAPPGVDEATQGALYARESVLWPVTEGRATITVCWLPFEAGRETFPVAALAPKLDTVLPQRKQWAQAIAESQWNALTPLRFVGWKDCDGTADVRLRPIGSGYTPSGCGTASAGQSCAEALGTDLRSAGGVANLNLLFGDEVRYSSLYEQSASGSSYQASNDLAYWWIPQACLEDFRKPWTSRGTNPLHKVDLNDPAASTAFDALYASCLQYNVLHELGHVAGFAHEQYRTDDAAQQKACYDDEQALGLSDDLPANVATRYRGTKTLGPFDPESIMSYCRKNAAPTLSDEDVRMATAVYGGMAPLGGAGGGASSWGGGGGTPTSGTGGGRAAGGTAGRGSAGSPSAGGQPGAGGTTATGGKTPDDAGTRDASPAATGGHPTNSDASPSATGGASATGGESPSSSGGCNVAAASPTSGLASLLLLAIAFTSRRPRRLP